MEKEIFMPLEFDKRTWDFSKKLFFLNPAFEQELTDDERQKYDYSQLESYTTIPCEEIHEKVEPFVEKLLNNMADSLEVYHNVGCSRQFWHRLLYVWVMKYCITGYYTVELFEKIKEQIGNQNIVTSMYKSGKEIPRCFESNMFDYLKLNDWMASIGTKIINLTVTYYQVDDDIKRNCDIGKFVKTEKTIYRYLKDFSIDKVRSKIYKSFFKNKAIVLLASSGFTFREIQQLIVSSNGKIQPLNFINTIQQTVIDKQFRKKMKSELKQQTIEDDLWKQIVADVIIDDFPAIFLELFSIYYSQSLNFFKHYPKMKAIKVATDLLGNSPVMFLCHLARELKDVKIIGEQHGGNYGIQRNITLYEEKVSDIFYGWGAWAQHRNGITKFKQGVSIKLHKHSKKKKNESYILYIGTAIPTKINFYFNQTQIIDGKRYIEWQIDFLSNLSMQNRKNLILRNYYVDYGWHVNSTIMKKFPEVKLSGAYNAKDLCEVDYSIRDADFSTLLNDCKIFVCDHLSTTWIEALKLGKPILLFFPESQYIYCESEKKYIKMMEDVEIIVHSPIRAAEIISKIIDDELWWNDNKRRQVVKKIKERYMGEECDAVKWWTEELLSIIK